MPNVVKAYAKYKNKGFEIVGVSLDKDHDAWVRGIKDLNITWPQMSDVKFWDSQVVDLYAIAGIPHTVLLDKEGIIIAKDLRGDELDRKLSELLQ
jgi:alkyl hydroperoxide reductase subunit AhpC